MTQRKKKWPPELVERIVGMKFTHTAREIAAMTGVTRNTVIGIWHRSPAPLMTTKERTKRSRVEMKKNKMARASAVSVQVQAGLA